MSFVKTIDGFWTFSVLKRASYAFTKPLVSHETMELILFSTHFLRVKSLPFPFAQSRFQRMAVALLHFMPFLARYVLIRFFSVFRYSSLAFDA